MEPSGRNRSQPPAKASSSKAAERGDSFYLGVAGDTAGYADLEHSLGTHLPLVLALVIASTLVVLFLMTGSLVLGVKAVLINALSLSACSESSC